MGHEVAIGRAHGAGDELVAHGPSVHDEVSLQSVRPVERRQPGEAFHRHGSARRLHGKRIVDEVGPEDAPEPRQRMIEQARRAGIEAERGAFAGRQRKRNLRVGEREPLDGVGDCRALGTLGLHEFEAGRRGVKQIAHLDLGTGGECCRLQRGFAPAIDSDPVRLLHALGAAGDGEPRYGADRGQRLAAKAERQDVGELVVGELRGGVALNRQRQVLRLHAGAVVGDADQPQAAARSRHVDTGGARVDRVLD